MRNRHRYERNENCKWTIAASQLLLVEGHGRSWPGFFGPTEKRKRKFGTLWLGQIKKAARMWIWQTLHPSSLLSTSGNIRTITFWRILNISTFSSAFASVLPWFYNILSKYFRYFITTAQFYNTLKSLYAKLSYKTTCCWGRTRGS